MFSKNIKFYQIFIEKMMNMIMVYLLFVIIASCLALQKDCSISQLDSNMKPLTVHAGQVTWPQNQQQIDQNVCRTMPKYVETVRTYTKKCASGEAKAILGVSLHAMDKMNVKFLCKNKSSAKERVKFMAAAKCANKGSKLSSKCWTKMISSVTAISNVTQSKDKFPLLCCSLLRWNTCFLKVYEDMGGPDCTPNQIEYMEQYLYKALIDPLNIFCSDYDESDKCNKFTKFMVSTENGKVKYGTPFPAIVNLFENL